MEVQSDVTIRLSAQEARLLKAVLASLSPCAVRKMLLKSAKDYGNADPFDEDVDYTFKVIEYLWKRL